MKGGGGGRAQGRGQCCEWYYAKLTGGIQLWHIASCDRFRCIWWSISFCFSLKYLCDFWQC